MQPQQKATLTQPFTLRERSYTCKAQWNSIGNSSTSNTCNPICIEGTILELQITMELHRQLIHQHHLQSHLHCGNDPTVTNHNGILSTAHARNTGETPFTMRNRSDRDPSMIRPWSEHDATTHETVSHPSHRRGRSSRFGDGLCMEKHRVSCICFQNIGFRASAISQKRISCETSFKTPSATPPPAPLAMPFALRERSYSCKSQWNSIGNSSTSTTCNPIYIAGTILQLQITMEFCRPHMHETQVKPHLQCGTDPTMIRAWSEHDPTTHETVSHPSHRRGRSSRFGDGLCMEKHRVSCICYQNIGFRASAISQKRISCETSFKTPSATPPPAPLAMPFALRERSYSCKSQWNSIGNSSTSTTCNPIYIAGTILQLQITMEFCRPHMHETQVKPHLQCGTDPTMIRAWSDHDPSMIRPHTRPSRTRRTAEVDHRGSGTDFVWKNTGFRASAISQKRISCETSFKNPTWRCHLQLTLSLTNSFFD